MQVQILDARYISMGKLMRLLNHEFGEGRYELESEDQGAVLRLTAPRTLTDEEVERIQDTARKPKIN